MKKNSTIISYQTLDNWLVLLSNKKFAVLEQEIKILKHKLRPSTKKRVPTDKELATLSNKANKFRDKLVLQQTKAEIVFKALLKASKIDYEFQHIIYYCNSEGKRSFYIVDFYLPKNKVVIEVDGGYHTEGLQQKLDKIRDKDLKITKEVDKVIRLTNEEVINYTENTIKLIKSL